MKGQPHHTKAPGGHSPPLLQSHATLQAFDAVNYLATVQLTKSPDTTLAGVPVSKAIGAGLMVAGKTVALIVFDHLNVADAMVVGVLQ